LGTDECFSHRHLKTNGDRPERMLGLSFDITKRKLAEEALSSMNRRVIEAEERERDRIANYLHENIGQRLTLFAIAIERLKDARPFVRPARCT